MNNSGGAPGRADWSVDPFGPEMGPAGHYLSPTLRQRLDLIEHLIEFGRQLIVLCGGPGSGKSTLLDRIAAGAGESWVCVRLHSSPALAAKTLLALLARELAAELVAGDDPAAQREAIRMRLAAIERMDKIPVLLLDDAQELPPDALDAVIELAQGADQNAALRVLMAADPERSPLLDSLQRARPQHGLVHVVEIPRLSAPQMQAFIERRMLAAGLAAEDWFEPSAYREIAAVAGGNPGKLTVLARQHLALQPRAAGTGTRAAWPRLKLPPLPRLPWRWPALLIVMAVAIGAWWALPTPRPAPHPSIVEINLPEPGPVAAPPAQAAAEPARRVRAPAAAPPDLSAPGDGEQALIEITLPDEPVPPQGASEPVVPPAVSEQSPAPLPPAPAPPPAVQPPVDRVPIPPSESPPEPAATPEPAGYSMAWLLKQPRNAYALQLFGVRDRAAAERFIKQHGIGAQSALVATTLGGQPWYVVVYGYYADREAALKAISALPSGMRGIEPWARTIGSLSEFAR